MGLQTYNKKRNFKVTPEPKGKLEPKKGHHYFIQKHDASHLHFDFRLELDGVLKSWAVPKGPSITPGVKRLAVEVEDHPLGYGDFEGTIPDGEYGGGTVMLWDKGTWTPDTDARKALEAGKLSFELKGERLKGSWTLVRTKSDEKGKNLWFLIKRTDASKKTTSEPVEKFKTSVASNRKMDEIAEGDHEWHSNQKAKKKVVKERPLAEFGLPKNFKPQLANLVDSPPDGDEWIHEIKFDGYRIIAVIKKNQVRLFSRNGLDWTAKMQSIADSIAQMNIGEAVLDGELIAPDKEGRSNFQALQNAFKEKSHNQMAYYVFDVPYFQNKDLTDSPLSERKKVLSRIFEVSAVPSEKIRISDYVTGNGKSMFDEAARLGLEGIISKKLDGGYHSGRTATWLKIKSLMHQEFVIVGYSEPGGSREHFGALLLAAHTEDGKLQYVGRTGTGFNSKILSELKQQFDKITLKKEPTLFDPDKEIGTKNGITWLEPQIVAEVKFASWTQHKILRQAVYLGLRNDKLAKDVRLERAKKVDAVIATKTKIKISKPDKVLFTPDITKQDLADYYKSIEKWIMPHVMNRPLSILRCPDGNDKMCFFQKHAATKTLGTKKQGAIRNGKSNEFLYVDSIEGVLSMIQLGVLEIHGWGTHIDHFEKPDLIVFDLDPDPGTSWDRIVETSFRIRDRLKLLKLKSFVKTTGGKGLHIVVPITPKLGWENVKSFCKSFSSALVEEFPKEYTINMSKDKRKGKIFIDYLRNGRGATAVLPYSTRAKSRAPVSTPLTWNELPDIQSADQFTLRNLNERIEKLKKDPWSDFFKVKQSLPKI